MADQKWVTTTAGVDMPGIIYGTAWKEERTADLVVMAVRAGFNGLDTACQPKHYREDLVGTALQRLAADGIRRADIFLQTKFSPHAGQDSRQVPYDGTAPIEQQVAQSFATSQHNLQTDYVDSLILHSPLAPYARLMRAWRALEEIHQTGGARQLGISNCYHLDLLRALYDDAQVKPAVVQNRFYPATDYDAALRRWCVRQRIVYQSFWTLTANPHILDSRSLCQMAHKYRKTAAQIFFRYLSHIGIVPLTGTCSEQHMREDLDIFAFGLSAEDREAVGQLLQTA
ncbi:MAG: aldo/keto reductase [Desulfosarcinaceae bacterium]|nr:aldo/keto reductase [Desulfosarcinaceae bacterium]